MSGLRVRYLYLTHFRCSWLILSMELFSCLSTVSRSVPVMKKRVILIGCACDCVGSYREIRMDVDSVPVTALSFWNIWVATQVPLGNPFSLVMKIDFMLCISKVFSADYIKQNANASAEMEKLDRFQFGTGFELNEYFISVGWILISTVSLIGIKRNRMWCGLL